MSDWASLIDGLNTGAISAFGKEVTYAPQDGVPFTLTGILDLGARREDTAPGTYALLFAKAAAFSEPPQRGGEVTVGNSIYKIVDLEADSEGGIRLVLHFNRSV